MVGIILGGHGKGRKENMRKKNGDGCSIGRENGRDFIEVQVFFPQAHQNSPFPIWRDLRRKKRGGVIKHQNYPSHHFVLALLLLLVVVVVVVVVVVFFFFFGLSMCFFKIKPWVLVLICFLLNKNKWWLSPLIQNIYSVMENYFFICRFQKNYFLFYVIGA